MGPVSITLDAALHDVTAALGADFLPGQKHVLGTRVDFSQSSSSDVIAYIATATPPTGFATGDVVAGPSYGNQVGIRAQVAAGEVVAFSKPADTGGQTWIYVQAGEAIARGEAVMLDATQGGQYIVSLSDEAGKATGVAQWNIPSGSFAWVLCAGVGKTLVGVGGATQGERVASAAAAGAGTDVATGADIGYGRYLETALVAALATTCIACPA